MNLQKGKFLINSIDDLDNILENKDAIMRVIDLAYMGRFEYEGNAIPISRMFIEYYKDDYSFYPIQIFNKNGQQMYIYANSKLVNAKLNENPNFLSDLANFNIDRNISLWNYINRNPEDCLYDFWWSIDGDYFILFGEEKKSIIDLFIAECYQRDGGKDEIKRKLSIIGYKI